MKIEDIKREISKLKNQRVIINQELRNVNKRISKLEARHFYLNLKRLKYGISTKR